MSIIGVVAPGAMGSAVARRFSKQGAQVLTLLEGRSEATRARAAEAGMEGTDEAGLMVADIILSIVPPAEALPIARQLSTAMRDAVRAPVYVDCNAIDVKTAEAIGAIVVQAGATFVDGGIIGTPPKPGSAGPTLYLSGDVAPAIAITLAALGLTAKAMSGPAGAASALKMSYAGITKGLTAIASVMVLGAERAGAGAALRSELLASQPELLARFTTALPDMVPKAYRWVAEMREIAAFLGDDGQIFNNIAAFYARIAADADGDRAEVDVIHQFLARS